MTQCKNIRALNGLYLSASVATDMTVYVTFKHTHADHGDVHVAHYDRLTMAEGEQVIEDLMISHRLGHPHTWVSGWKDRQGLLW